MHKPSSQILNLFYKINWKFDYLGSYAMNIKNPRYVINKADNQNSKYRRITSYDSGGG